jgi:RHS repeat-associated protein
VKKYFASILLFAATRLLAVSPVPFTEGVSFSAKVTGSSVAVVTVYGETTESFATDTTESESVMKLAWLKPGRAYICNVQFNAFAASTYSVGFIVPGGYRLLVNGADRDLITVASGTGWSSTDYTLEVQPVHDLGRAEAGAFGGIKLGKSVTWDVGLGGLRTGRSAGRIYFKEYDFSGSPANRARLYYAAPANVGQITVVRDGPSAQTLRQIMTPQALADLTDLSGDPNAGYQIAFYTPAQATWNGSSYTLSGSPWKTVRMEPTGTAGQCKITETEGSVVRVSQLTAPSSASGNYTWTLQEGGPSNNWLRTTTHTSTLITPAVATGGTVSTSGGYTIHAFTGSGAFTANQAVTVEALLVAGGGGGGGGLLNIMNAGGGGGGGVLLNTALSLSATSYSVTVGAGGTSGLNGGNTTFAGLTAIGGGHGAHSAYAAPGAAGGSGGGEGTSQGGGAGAGVSGQGTNGTAGAGGPYYEGGGGGGATSSGSGRNGGNGYGSSLSGSFAYYGGGGGAGTNDSTGGSGGLGGGGAGGGSTTSQGGAGTANTGGGGGGSSQWTSTGGAGGSGIVIVRYSATGASYREVVAEVRTGGTSGTIISKTKYRYENVGGWGEELDSVIADPDASNPAERTTTYAYHTNSSNKGNYRLLKSVTAPTGAWTAWEYYDDWDRRGRVKYQFQPWLDSPSAASSASATTGRVVFSEYTTDWTGRYTRPTLREERINNTLVGQTTWSHGDVTGSGEPRAYASINSYRDGTNSHTDYVETYRADADPDFAGQLYQSKGANLAQTSGSVSRGTFNPSTKAFTVGSSGDHWRELKFNGSTSSTGADSVTSFNSQSCPAVYLIPNKSTLDVTIRIAQGYVYRTETYVYTGSGNFSLMTSEDFDYDAYGHLTQRSASNGALTNYSYPNGRLTSTTDPAGTETQFTYDAIGRVATSVKKGAAAFGSYAAQGDITTTPTYDGANNVTRTVVSGGALSQTAATPFDLAGRLTSSTAPGGYTTAFAYSSGGKVITATLPGGATRITETYLDGQAKSLTGTAVVAEYYSYSVNSTTGTITRQVNFGTSASTALVKTTTDWLGRKIKEERPTFSGSGTFTLTFTYNSLGQLVARSETGLSDALYSYDTLGTLTREGLDIGGNGTLDLASSDRITDHAWTFFTASSAWWKRDTTTTYATASSSTSTQLGKVETQLSGLPTNRLTRTDSTDIFGNVTSQFVDVNRSGKLVTTTTDAPDSTTDTQQIAYNGLVVSSRDTANLTTTFGHDALGRPVTSVDPRTGTTTTAYVSGTSQVSTVTDPASIVQATYTYDSAGRVSSVKDALNKYAYTSYTTRGEVYRQWGDTTYPVENGYDTWGRRTTMKTYRAGSGWTGSTWPTGTTGTADTTTWAYQESTGLLSSKTDAANKAVTYTYTARGQIDVRTWARGVTTDYGYSATTGELTSVNYSDSTPDLAYTYNRLGSSANVTDYTGTRTLNYNLAGTLEMQSEDLPAFFGSRRITWPHATSGIIGRPTGLQLGTSGSPTSEQNVTWGYDPYGRFNSLAGGGTTLAYTYATNSNLLASIADTASGWTQTRSYVTNRDLLDIIETKISTTSKAKFDYAHDNLGRRTSVNKTGDLYSRYGNGSQGLDTAWGYDDRSQVTSEQTKLGGSATVLTGRDDAYAFDNIGNRATATHNSQLTTYTSTLLNTYSQRTVPGVFDVAGAAGSGTTVTVNGSSSGVTRHGEYFFNGQSMSNGSGAVFSTLAVSDGTTATNLGAFLAGTPEAFSYDDDGNLLSDGRWDYVYDAENRLVSMQTHTALSPTPLANADARRIEFKSDYLGRRVQKTVRDGWNGSTFATVVSDEKFVYDGWNCIAKLNASSLSLIASYFWGLDWSGTLQGAGGVGGLALTVEGGNTYLPMFDGNGNVMGMIKASDGSLAAAYEYDAFGNTLRESGPYAASNPFRFSTKYTDLETGLVYYGLRYYAPWLGRFLNKDPISERGGLNLYAFCENDGVNHWDYLGMNPPFRGFAPVSPVDPNIMRIGAANNAIYQYNTFIAAPATAVITAPVTRTVVGGGRAISGVINMVAGANVAGAGTAATVTIPVIGQVSGPAAVTLGSAQMTYGYYGFMSGMIDVSKGLSGQGYSPIQSLQPIAPIPTSSTTSGSFTGSVEPGILKLETFVVTVTKGVTDKNPKPDTPKPGSKGNAGTGSGNTSRQSRTTPGATVITDPDAIADILGSLGSAADAAIKAEVQRIQSENMQ